MVVRDARCAEDQCTFLRVHKPHGPLGASYSVRIHASTDLLKLLKVKHERYRVKEYVSHKLKYYKNVYAKSAEMPG